MKIERSFMIVIFASTREGIPTSLKKVGIIYKADLDDMICNKCKKGNGVSKRIIH
jgi:hypothetical protein